MTRIRTLDFLPGIFQTETNSQFLAATLDQIVNPPVIKKIQGYVGSKVGYGVDAKDYYVTEPTKIRRDYQLEPGVTFLKDNETTAYDFISYPGIIDSLKLQGAITNRNDTLFTSQFYSWDSFTNLDKIINYNQYYWLPDGPPAVTVAASTVFTTNDYIVKPLSSAYNITPLGALAGTNNPTITLLRGGIYNFIVDQDTEFWIQGKPGITGYDPAQTNLYTRDIYGVSNNGAKTGVVQFQVPQADAQNEFNYPGNNSVGVISTMPFNELNGKPLRELPNGIDGVTALNGRTVMFYDTGIDNEIGYVGVFYDGISYDTNLNRITQPETIQATSIDAGGVLTVSNTANLSINQTVTFTGTSFGGIQTYNPNISDAISVGSIVVGKSYFISTQGTTNFTTIGAPNNNLGTIFTATATGTGTGQVIPYEPDIYYISNIDTGSNTITISQTLGGPIFVPSSAGSGTLTVNTNQGLFEQGFYSPVNDYFYTIVFLGDQDDPVISLRPASLIPIEQRITPLYGTEYIGLPFVKKVNGAIQQIPYISAPLNTLYYQDGSNKNRVGVIKLIENNETNLIDVTNDILGQKTYTAKNGVVFTNGLKVEFNGDVIPRSYLQGEYYVEGVGTDKGIELIPVESLVIPEPFTTSTYSPYDVLPYDNGPFDEGLNIPTTPDYITIARNSISKNAWSRSNRWFHIDVINATAQYNNNPEILDAYAEPQNKAKRPILEFYPNLKLFNSGTIGKDAVDFVDTRTTDAFNYVEGQQNYYPDVQTYTDYEGTVNANDAPIAISNLLQDQWYAIESLGSTELITWESLGAVQDQDGEFEIGVQYIITDLGTATDWNEIAGTKDISVENIITGTSYIIETLGDTPQAVWNIMAGTTGVLYTSGDIFTAVAVGTGTGIVSRNTPYSVGEIFTAAHPGSGTGTGTAFKTLFRATAGGVLTSYELKQGSTYTILSLGTTQWQNIGASATPFVGEVFVANVAGLNPGDSIYAVGTGTALQGNGTAIQKSTTTISIDPQYVAGDGVLRQGQWINDLILNQASILPAGTRILSVDSYYPNVEMTVYWPIPSLDNITPAEVVTNASFVASDKDNTDLLLFPGSRIVFTNDVNEEIRNKIFVVNFANTGSQPYPVISLTEASDGQILENDQFVVLHGYNYTGTTFYHIDNQYQIAQEKTTVNQAPLFDVFDENNISYGDQEIYNSSSFAGSKLFNYKLGVGINDAVLGFPISYSSINNVGDISFEVSLYTQKFNYISNGSSVTSPIKNGFVFNYSTRSEYERLIGWQTAVAPSTQYQVFQFNYSANIPPLVLESDDIIPYTFTVDVPQLSIEETVWPSLQVYNNNNLLTLGTDYVVQNTENSTIITVYLTEDIDTPIQVLILSNKASDSAYYAIPINLSNNPFNTDPTSVDIGDIRGQYQSIFENNPDTTGMMFGSNNYRDLGNMVPWGTRIIQNSSSLVLPGAFLRNPRNNLYDALLFNSREYVKFKTLLVDTTDKLNIQQKYDPAVVLDLALDEITSVKSQDQPFFWSDMIPNKAPFISNVYSFANQAETSVFPLSKIYDFTSANYDGVLVYLQRKVNGVLVTKQLFRDSDYVVSTDSPSVRVNIFLQINDKIIVKEYNQTYGSYIPNTPTKLGLYPLYIPSVVLDDTYNEPTYFIQGHDGSYNKLYGEYNADLGMLVDFRDQVLFEFETRVYNNIKLSRSLPVDLAEVVPGYFRDTGLSYLEWTEIYSKNFLDWIGQNRLDYKLQLFNPNNPYTFNYRGSTFKLDNSFILQGYWRGIYEYLYDTSTPNLTPWAMIGYANKPSWWETRYGPAPYTSDNLILWTDLQNGYDYNNGVPVTRPLYARPGLLDIIPVDDQGNLRQPLDSVIANFNQLTFKREWRVGDDAPVEYSYRKSSSYPFDLMRLEALLRPAEFYNLGADLDNYKYDAEFNQFLVNGRTHLIPSQIEIYGNGTAKTSYINWIVDYEKQLGVDATNNIKKLLNNLDVRLVYRLAGFSDKTLLKFFVEKGTPESRNSSLLIPDESYQVLLYQNQPMTKLVYSGVVVQSTIDGYAVYGNNQTSAFFKTLKPILNGTKSRVSVQDATVQIADNYSTIEEIVPYGTIFYSTQDVSQFLMSYGAWLEANGAKFEDQQRNIPITWRQMVAEFLYWTQMGFITGSLITLNPAARKLTIDKESQVVQPLTYDNSNFILNNNLYPIQNRDLSIVRSDTMFTVAPLNEGDAVAYGQFNLTNIEHGIVFQNETLFNDTIYNLISGLKQNRVYVRGTKSAEWNGTLFASGFIYNQDNIEQWSGDLKYTKGSIVKYKNKYFTALKIVQPGSKFKEDEWKETEYNEIQQGLLPNSSTRSYESALYYNSYVANLEKDSDLLAFSLIGFRPREYMASADLTDITQVNVYKNMIKEKGTLNAVKAFKGANLPQGGIDYDVYENWAILQGTFGGTLNDNFVQFRLNESKITNNPSIVGLTDGNDIEGAQQLVPLYSLFNYGRPLTDTNILPEVSDNLPSTTFPTAGYVNIDDIKMAAYFYSNLPRAVDKKGSVIPLRKLYVGDYVWLADYQSSWQILTPTSIGRVILLRNNLDGTCVLEFAQDHGLSRFDIFAVLDFNKAVNGYYIVNNIINPKEVLITLSLPPQVKVVSGQGVSFKFLSQRVEKPSDIQSLPLLNNEFVQNKVWVNENNDGGWAVYQKDINYKYKKEFEKSNSEKFGSAVAYTPLSDYLISDPVLGEVYRYQYDEPSDTYEIDEILTGNTSFGTSITHEQNLYVISQPENTPKVVIYTVNDTKVTDNIILYQEILASDIDPAIDVNFGKATALSQDTNWLFISDYRAVPSIRNKVHVFRKRDEIVYVGSGTLLDPSYTYQIVEPGTVNWTDIAQEPIANEKNIYFKYESGAVITGEGVAVRCDYQYMTTIDGGITADNFGQSLATNYDGTILTVGAPSKDLAVVNEGKAYVYNRLVQNYETQQDYAPSEALEIALAWSPAVGLPLTVTKNGILVENTEYSFSGSTLFYNGEFMIGDIITISGNEFVLIQEMTLTDNSRIGPQFGHSVDNNLFGTEILIGSPFYISSRNSEGSVFRYTNGSARFGYIIGVNDTNVTTNRQLLINGYLVDIPAGNANLVASAINNAGITNIIAGTAGGKLTISLINQNLALANQELLISATDTATLDELGFEIYTLTQTILNPHLTGPSQFGTVIKFNDTITSDFNSVAISAPTGTRYALSTFDFTDDGDYKNDTIFDNNTTQFLDSFPNAGAVYTFDYLSNYNESLTDIGQYIYAQSVNDINLEYGAQPRYGTALDWYDNKIIIGTPDYRPEDVDGQVVVYESTALTTNWFVLRQSSPVVDINRIYNIQLFSAETNNTLQNLDYMDPLQGKLLGAIRQNIDVISNIDPANYNIQSTPQSIVWGENKLGTIWFDTSNIRYVDYHQNDNLYNSRYWGTMFPGSNVAVYSWVASNVIPSSYQGPGVPKDITSYTVQTTLNSSNVITPVYYFWVRNTGIVFNGKTLSDANIAQYLIDPKSSGISYLAPILPDAVALYNVKPYIASNDTVLQLGYSTGAQDNPAHQQYTLIRQDLAEDFLPGVPGTRGYITPESLYDRFLDSMSGVDEQGAVVPNPFLPKAVQSGVLARPRQSFFYNRYAAIQNYLQYANSIMKLYPIAEIRSFNFLNTSGLYFDTKNYWEYINWWAEGYDNNTKAVLQVSVYADLSTLEVNTGTIVSVAKNNNAATETYRYDGDGVWTRIGLQNGTIRFKDELYDYDAAGFGFGGTFYDTDSFDVFPSEETRYIIRALNEQIYTDELLIHRNKSLILIFEYIQEETVENQNYLPWLNKTSLVDVAHKVRDLKPLQNFVSDNEQFLEGYVNETKPYHVVIKEFSFDYTGGDVYPGTITDFDLPSTYDTTIDKFVSPQLVYNNDDSAYEFLPDSPVWKFDQYKEWYNNYGLNLSGQPNYNIAKLESYLTLSSQDILVDNPQGFPVNGIMIIGQEKISYASVDKTTGLITGLTRGVEGTQVVDHLPGEQIYMDLPGVVVLDTGRNYANPPRIVASIDTSIYPAPRTEAVLEAVMSLGSVVAVNVVNPGEGYAVLPEIVIDPSEIFEFNSANVNVTTSTITLYAPTLVTGDLVRYVTNSETTENIGGIADRQYYYINVLSSSPTTIMALYANYADAVNDNNRVKLLSQGSGIQTFDFGARAFAVASSSPIRENNITLRFDRTTYDSQVTNWEPNKFYGSEFVSYTLESASSPVTLASVQPDINTILSSAQGTSFPIVDVTNDRQTDWSTFERTSYSIIAGNQIVLSFTSDLSDENPSGSTIGFYPGMPVRFHGPVTGSQIIPYKEYYVDQIIDLSKFTISETEGGSTFALTANPNISMIVETAKVTDTAEITTIYSGYRTVSATSQSNNIVTVDLTSIGTGGTRGFYTGLPIYFTGTMFGGIEANKAYYVVSVLGTEQFTLSDTPEVTTIHVLETNAASQIIVQNTNGLNVNDPVVFDSITINGEGSDTFGNIQKQTIYYINSIGINVITISTTQGGPIFNTGVVPPSDNTYCYITDQASVKQLTNGTGNCTLVVSLPVSPGQVDGQRFTFYPTSQHYSNITVPDITYGNLLQKNIEQTLSDNNIAFEGNRTGLYEGFPFTVSANVGGLVTDKTYYAYDLGNIQLICSTTTASTLTYDATFSDYEMEITAITDGSGMIYPGTLVEGEDVIPNTYVTAQLLPLNPGETLGGVGRYSISKEYFVPVITTNVTSATGIISVGSEYNTDMIYVGMPIVFTGSSLGGILLNFTYYVRHILDSSRFTISTIKNGASISLTVSTGTIIATGSSATKAYLPTGSFIAGDYYDIKSIGDTDWSAIGATYLVAGDNIVAGNYYIINDTGSSSDSFWSVIAGQNIEVEKDTIVYAEASGVLTLTSGTAYLLRFQATGTGSSAVSGEATVVLSSDDTLSVMNQKIVKDPILDVGYVLGGYSVIINDGGEGFTQNNTITVPGDVLGGMTPDNDLTMTVSRINAVVPGAFSWSLPRESNGIITKIIASGTSPGSSRNYFLKVTGSNTFKVYSDPLMKLPVSGIDFPYEGLTQVNINQISNIFITLTDTSGLSVNDNIIFSNLPAGITLVEGQTYYVLSIVGNMITIGTNPGDSPVDAGIGGPYTANKPVVTKPGSFMMLPEPFVFTPSIVKYNNRVWVCTVSNNDSDFEFGKWEPLNSGDRRLNALDRAIGYYQPDANMPGVNLPQLFTGLTYPNTTYLGNAFQPGQQYPLDTQLVNLPFYPKNVSVPAIEWDGTNYIAPANLPNYAAVIADIEVQDDWLISTLANQPLALTDILKVGDLYLMTSANAPTPLFKSTDKVRWSTNGFFVPADTPPNLESIFKVRLIASAQSYNAIAHHDFGPDPEVYVAVGTDIISSNDATLWYERLKFPTAAPTRRFYGVSYVETTQFSGFVAVGQNLSQPVIAFSLDGESWTRVTQSLANRTLKSVTSGFNTIFAVGTNGGILTSQDATLWTQLPTPLMVDYNDVKFVDDTLVIVGNNGTVLVSTNGASFVQKATGTTENLNSIMYVEERGQWTIVGNNNTILQTQDITATPVVWDTTQIFSTPDPEYTVKGDPFQAGYGPEEMVPGIVTDQLTMIVNTRAGTNWPATQYAHVGYNVVSTEYEYNVDNEYSFDEIVQDPAYINVFKVVDGTSITLYDTTDYTVDWVNKVVSLNFNKKLIAGQELRIDVYEVGNGDQLVKSSTYDDPIELNIVTGFNEIALDCNYNNTGYNSGGIVIENTSGEFYAEPAMFYNGQLLTPGLTNIVLATNAATHYITTYSTQGLVVDQPIVFSDTMFGGVTPHTTYYIRDIINLTQFTIKDSMGEPVYLTTAAGNAVFVTNDYAVAVADNQINAKVIFAAEYDKDTDYLAYSFFGPSEPLQYGFTIPQTQQFMGQGIKAPYQLTNNMGGDNIENAIVEVNGLRIDLDQYSIHPDSKTLAFASLAPDANSTIAVTTFNDTQRQYLNTTQYNTRRKQVTPISNVNNTITLLEPTVRVTTIVPHNLVDGDIVRIDGCNGAEQLNNHPPFIVEKVDDYTVKLFDYIEGIPLSASGPVNIVDAYLGGGYIWKAYSWILHTTIAAGCESSEISAPNVDKLVVDTPVIFTEDDIALGTSTSIPQIIAGKTYFVKSIDYINSTFTISETQGGDILTLSNVEPATSEWIIDHNLNTQFVSVTPIFSNDEAVTGRYDYPNVYYNSANTVTVTFNSETTGNVAIAGNIANTETYYLHTQSVASTTWTVDHNLNSEYVVVAPATADDLSWYGKYDAPVITYDNANTLTLTFSSAQTGNVAVIGSSNAGGYYTYTQSTPSNVWEITHNLSAKYVTVTPIYSNNMSMVGTYDYPNISYDNANVLTLTFSSSQTGNVVVVGGPSSSGYFVYRSPGKNIRVTQWEQTNVDRLWVTVNGRRVASSNLRLNEANEVSILTEVMPEDSVIITSMMPSATPDSNTYLQMVNAKGEAQVYRSNSDTKTWLTEAVGEYADTIKVDDVTRLTNVVVQNNTTPVAVLGYHEIPLMSNRMDIAQVRVYNNNPARLGYIDQDYLVLRVSGIGPYVAIQSGVWIEAGDQLTITTLEGKTLYVNGEFMTILSVDQSENIIEVQRGAQGSMVNIYIPNYSTVYGLLEQNRMSQINYNETWNPIPGIYNTTEGDPLQIADTSAARFLRTDIT